MRFFSEESSAFLQNLDANNDRHWFQDNRGDYERFIKQPAESFAELMVSLLEENTKIPHKYKILRIFRDVRFSVNKAPYACYARIVFSPIGEGNLPGWFFSLETDGLVLGTGVFAFDNAGLNMFRRRLDGPAGPKLQKLWTSLKNKGARMGEPALKRVPAPYPADHPCADLLLFKGLTAWIDVADVRAAYGPDAPGECLKEFGKIRPLFDWLL